MRKPMFLILACLALLFAGQAAALASPAAAGTVTFLDDANLLSSGDRSTIQSAAQSLPYPVIVWTTTRYTDKAQFYQAVSQRASAGGVAIGINNAPNAKYSHISATSNTGLTTSDADSAIQAANAQFSKSAWGAGIAAALGRLAAASGSSGSGGSTGGGNTTGGGPLGGIDPTGGSSGGIGCLGGLCLLVLVLGVGGFLFMRNRGASRNMAAGQQYPMQGQTPYGQGQAPGQAPGQPPYNPYGPQGPGYGPGYGQQGSNIGGNIASGLGGAALGGLAGYELGKHQADQQQNQNPYPQGQDFGSSGQDYGGGGMIESSPGGSGNDFGGGSDLGGGSDFGGGDSGGGDSGGGSDF